MLTTPDCGWSNFSLPGSQTYGLSYAFGDLPFDWLEAAIHGLKTASPFCVDAYMEPGHLLCVVGKNGCHIIVEDEFADEFDKGLISQERINVTMVDFCQSLLRDISKDFDAWVHWLFEDEIASDVDFPADGCSTEEEYENAVNVAYARRAIRLKNDLDELGRQLSGFKKNNRF